MMSRTLGLGAAPPVATARSNVTRQPMILRIARTLLLRRRGRRRGRARRRLRRRRGARAAEADDVVAPEVVDRLAGRVLPDVGGVLALPHGGVELDDQVLVVLL